MPLIARTNLPMSGHSSPRKVSEPIGGSRWVSDGLKDEEEEAHE